MFQSFSNRLQCHIKFLYIIKDWLRKRDSRGVQSVRTWECSRLSNMWGHKIYRLNKKDFCKPMWNNVWWPSSQPRCDDQIAPIVSFYAGKDSNQCCSINMNAGRGEEFQRCLDIVTNITANQGNQYKFEVGNNTLSYLLLNSGITNFIVFASNI